MTIKESIKEAFDCRRDNITGEVICRQCKVHYNSALDTEIVDADTEYIVFYCPRCGSEL